MSRGVARAGGIIVARTDLARTDTSETVRSLDFGKSGSSISCSPDSSMRFLSYQAYAVTPFDTSCDTSPRRRSIRRDTSPAARSAP